MASLNDYCMSIDSSIICAINATNVFVYLARLADLPEGLYILFALISFFFFFLLWAKLSQYLLDRFSRSFHQMEDICVNFLNQVQFFRLLKGRCHGNQFSGKNGAKLPTPTPLKLSLCQSKTKWDIVTSMCALSAQMMPLYRVKISWTFCSNSRVNGAHLYTFYDVAKNGIFSQIYQDILDWFLLSIHNMKALWVQMIDLYLVFRFIEGRWHGNQLILRKWHERRLIPLAFLALSFENELQYHCLNVRANSGDDVAIWCKNVVNFCQVL